MKQLPDLSTANDCPNCEGHNIRWGRKGECGGFNDYGDNYYIVCDDCGLIVSYDKNSWCYWSNPDNILKMWNSIGK